MGALWEGSTSEGGGHAYLAAARLSNSLPFSMLSASPDTLSSHSLCSSASLSLPASGCLGHHL